MRQHRPVGYGGRPVEDDAVLVGGGEGLLPGGGGTQRAPRLISRGRAAWLTYSGERIPAETAEAWGLVEFVVDDLEGGIAQYVEPLDKQSPHAIRQIKSFLRAHRPAQV